MSFTIAPIVEGHGDFAAVPILLRRMVPMLAVARPVRFPRSKLIIPAELIRAARIAEANISDQGAVLLVMDADEDCAATLGPQLQQTLSRGLPHRLCRVVLAVREFEAWIVGGDVAYGVDAPDSAGGLKDRIKARYGVYSETIEQPRLIAAADIRRLCAMSRSFQKLQKVVDEFAALAEAS